MKTTIAVGNKRLLKLAAFLRTIPRRRFDYGAWTGEDWKGAQDLSCGTTACAMGWAATMPEFRRLGLYIAPKGDFKGVPTHGRKRGSDAGIDIFALDWSQADYLFFPSWDGTEDRATPKQVARKIEKFVAGRSA